MYKLKQIPVLKLKLSLNDSKPLIWRTIIVPKSTKLHGLHRKIQILMQWWDYHLYKFEFAGEIYEEPGLPWLIDGERLGPPEDCGGLPGLETVLKACRNRQKEEYRELLAWLGDDYIPENFDIRTINHFLILASAWMGLTK